MAIEKFLQRRLDAFVRRKIYAERVDVLLIFVELEVQVGAGAATGGAYVSDNLALPHRRAVVNPFRESIQMRVTACVSRAVLDIYGLSVISVPSGESDDAVAHSANRGSSLGGEVDAGMRQINL